MGEPRYPYVHVDVPPEASEEVATMLWDLGAQGVEERDASTMNRPDASGRVTLVASFPEEADARRAADAIAPRFAARVEFVVGDAWRDAWKEFFHTARIGQRLVVRPSWESVKTWPDEVVLTIDPGRAFGSGTHETTRLVLREIDRRVHGGERILDVGCGSGILSVAALLLGAEHATAVDVERDAIEVTLENAKLNGVDARIAAATTPIASVKGEWPLVVANIEKRVLVPLAHEIAARVAPGGLLVLSGILLGEQDDVAAAYRGMKRLLTGRDGEWVSLVLAKEG